MAFRVPCAPKRIEPRCRLTKALHRRATNMLPPFVAMHYSTAGPCPVGIWKELFLCTLSWAREKSAMSYLTVKRASFAVNVFCSVLWVFATLL